MFSRARVILSVALVALCAAIVAALVRGRHAVVSGSGSGDSEQAVSSEVEPRRRERPRSPGAILARSKEHLPEVTGGAKCSVDNHAVFRAVRVATLAIAQGYETSGVEAAANQAEPYLLGMIHAMRTIDPQLLVGLRDEFAADLCGPSARSGVDLMMYAKAVLMDSSIASSKANNCALKRLDAEDATLWSLLDAWNASGREPLPALADIRRWAVDERTMRRLGSPREAAEARMAMAEEISSRVRVSTSSKDIVTFELAEKPTKE
jgi:hypothetical protein